MQIEEIPEDEFFNGLNQRISTLAEKIEETATNIKRNPNSSTYHMENFFYPLQIMRKLQQIRDKARAFKENENEDIIYVKGVVEGEETRYYYFPKSQYENSRLPELIKRVEQLSKSDPDLGYIS